MTTIPRRLWQIAGTLAIAHVLLIPIGIARQKRRDRQARERGEEPALLPVIDLNNPRMRNRVVTFAVLTAINVVILSAATYKGVDTMESTEFCGQACHSVMAPEDAAFQRGAHASVRCVDCHNGPGADWVEWDQRKHERLIEAA